MMFFLSFDFVWKLFFKCLFVTKSVGNTLLKLTKLIYIVTHHLSSVFFLSEEKQLCTCRGVHVLMQFNGKTSFLIKSLAVHCPFLCRSCFHDARLQGIPTVFLPWKVQVLKEKFSPISTWRFFYQESDSQLFIQKITIV